MSRTREERRRRSQLVMRLLTALCFALLLTIVLAVMTTPASRRPVEPVLKEGPAAVQVLGRLPGDDAEALERCYMTAEEIAADWAAHYGPLAETQKLEHVRVTHYCTEKRRHVCGSGHGITASGRPVEAYRSCAVDPAVIPLGSVVLVDYGDGTLHEYRADDTGGGVKGRAVDLAVAGHEEALQLGVKRATVYWR